MLRWANGPQPPLWSTATAVRAVTVQQTTHYDQETSTPARCVPAYVLNVR